MKKYLLAVSLFLALFSCKKDNENLTPSADSFKADAIAQKYGLKKVDKAPDRNARTFASINEFEAFLAKRQAVLKKPQAAKATTLLFGTEGGVATGNLNVTGTIIGLPTPFDMDATVACPALQTALLPWVFHIQWTLDVTMQLTYIHSEVLFNASTNPGLYTHLTGSATTSSVNAKGVYTETYIIAGNIYVQNWVSEFNANYSLTSGPISGSIYFTQTP